MKCGNYLFYFRLADADGNETDFIGQSNNVVCHIGNLNDPHSIRGGIREESSGKMVKFLLTDLDTAYDYVNVYYSRKTSDMDMVAIITYHFIDRKYKIEDGQANIVITGFEQLVDVTQEDINIRYEIVKSAKTAC